jgi:hypothetical protein
VSAAVRQGPDRPQNVVFLLCMDDPRGAHLQSQIERALSNVDGHHFRPCGRRNHDR